MHKALHIAMIILLLLSTTGVAISEHYCGSELKAVAINQEANSCKEDMEMPKGCCHSESNYFSVDDDFNVVKLIVNLDAPEIVALLNQYWLVVNEFDNITDSTFQYTNEMSPLIETDIYIQIQSFLL